METKKLSRSEEGFTLPELIMSVIIFAIVAVVSMTTVIAITESTQQSAFDSESQVEMSNLVSTIERDMITAKSVWVKNDHQLVLTNPDNSLVVYYPAQKGFNPTFSVPRSGGSVSLNPAVVPTPTIASIIRHTVSPTGSQNAEVAYDEYMPIDVNNPIYNWNNGSMDLENHFDMFEVLDLPIAESSNATNTSVRNDKKYTVAITLKDYNNESVHAVSKRKIVAGTGRTDSAMMP